MSKLENAVNRSVNSRTKSGLFSVAAAISMLILFNLNGIGVGELSSFLTNHPEQLSTLIPLGLLTIAMILFAIKYWLENQVILEYLEVLQWLDTCESSDSISFIRSKMGEARNRAQHNRLVGLLWGERKLQLKKRLTEVNRTLHRKLLDREYKGFLENIEQKIEGYKHNSVLWKAKAKIEAAKISLDGMKIAVIEDWNRQYEEFSWWNKLKYGGSTPTGLAEIESAIQKTEGIESNFISKHKDDFKTLDAHFETVRKKALSRALDATNRAMEYIDQATFDQKVDDGLMKRGYLFSLLSIPVSIWDDVDRAGDIFDALRDVNSNFAGLSDVEIWWETLFLSSTSLAGMISLTKGAYFERLVVDDTGGALFEHFNHPDTDIVIDGIAYQLKATSNESYINSVDDDIPVIATSEVAATTNAIDSGFSDKELSDSVDLAIGGVVIDVGDTAVDAILSGVGGLGFLASLEGFNHAISYQERGQDRERAIEEGISIAVEGTARATVNTAELVFNVVTSMPFRFVGRMLHKGAVKLDDKMSGK